jgi:hypothetical protein
MRGETLCFVNQFSSSQNLFLSHWPLLNGLAAQNVLRWKTTCFFIQNHHRIFMKEPPAKPSHTKPQPREIIVINRTESHPISWFDWLERVLKLIAVVAIPFVVACIGGRVQTQLAQNVAKQEYVKIAVSILTVKMDDKNQPLRDWAVNLLNEHSSVKLTPEAIAKLKSGEVNLPFLADEAGRTLTDERGMPITADSAVITADEGARLRVEATNKGPLRSTPQPMK